MPRYYDERIIQPVIHTKCDFNATTDTIVHKFRDRLADKTASEGVVDGRAHQILVEIKGTGTFPYNLACTDDLDPLFCQMMQLAALALIN